MRRLKWTQSHVMIYRCSIELTRLIVLELYVNKRKAQILSSIENVLLVLTNYLGILGVAQKYHMDCSH